MSTRHAPGTTAPAELRNYRAAVDAALRSNRDVWGETVLRAPDGPSFTNVAPFLTPLMYGDSTYLTDTGVHYLVFTEPITSSTFALHVADGSQILVEYSNRWGAPEWGVKAPRPARGPAHPLFYSFRVGPDATELFGTHEPDLLAPRLSEGWLPILENTHVDGSGTTWERESFATRDPETGLLASYVRFRLDSPGNGSGPRVRVTAEQETRTLAEHSWVFAAPGEEIHLRLANQVEDEPIRQIPAHEYDAARGRCVDYWRSVFAEGPRLTVPDRMVSDAWHNLVIQNSVLGERYSIGNPYETTFLMEAHGAVLALLRWGHTQRATECLERLVDMTNGAAPEWYESWERGIKLSAAAEHARLTGDPSFVERHLETYLGYLDDFAAQRRRDPLGLLAPERYAWDIPTVIYGWHSQATAWKGAHDLLTVLADRDHPAATTDRLAEVAEFRAAIERAMERSQVDLDDGGAFIPVALLSDERPHQDLTGTRLANYWNLVAPYALATGIVEPGSPLARGLLHYMATHGAWLLGLTRFNGLEEPPTPIGGWREDGTGGYRTPGIDNAFGVQTLFFLADNGEADRLALTMYAKLAHGMTRGTFVDGEATSIGVYKNDYFRSAWYPPNGTSNSLFLEALRLLLVRPVRDPEQQLEAIDLAWATPRWWLGDGGTTALSQMMTALGPVSFSIDSELESSGRVLVDVSAPPGAAVRLHVRLPQGWRVDPASGGERWDPAGEYLDLGEEGLSASFTLRAVQDS